MGGENILKIGMDIVLMDSDLRGKVSGSGDEVLTLRCSYSVGDPAVTVVTIR